MLNKIMSAPMYNTQIYTEKIKFEYVWLHNCFPNWFYIRLSADYVKHTIESGPT